MIKSENTKRVAFDLGNVLFHVDLMPFITELVNRQVYSSYDEAGDFMDGICPGHDLGLYSVSSAISSFNPHISRTDLDVLCRVWADTIRPCNEMIDLVRDLISSRYDVALLSNVGSDHVGVIRRWLPIEIWDKTIHYFSCNTGTRKPDRLFYQSFHSKNEGWPTDTFFFDDKEENVIGCDGYFRGVHFNLADFSSGIKAAKAVRAFLLDSRSQGVV